MAVMHIILLRHYCGNFVLAFNSSWCCLKWHVCGKSRAPLDEIERRTQSYAASSTWSKPLTKDYNRGVCVNSDM